MTIIYIQNILNFGLVWDIADAVTHIKFNLSQFGWFGRE